MLLRKIASLVLTVLMAEGLRAAETRTFDRPQLAGISGFRAFRDTSVLIAENGLVAETKHSPGGAGPNAVWLLAKRDGGLKTGAIVFDAVHRSVLVRFPGSAQSIADTLRKGFAVGKFELVLPHRATELWAESCAAPPRAERLRPLTPVSAGATEVRFFRVVSPRVGIASG